MGRASKVGVVGRWFPIVYSGEILWTGMLLLVGYFATEALKGAEEFIVYLGAVVSVLLVGGIMVIFPRRLNRYIETSEIRVELL